MVKILHKVSEKVGLKMNMKTTGNKVLVSSKLLLETKYFKRWEIPVSKTNDYCKPITHKRIQNGKRNGIKGFLWTGNWLSGTCHYGHKILPVKVGTYAIVACACGSHFCLVCPLNLWWVRAHEPGTPGLCEWNIRTTTVYLPQNSSGTHFFPS